MRKLLSIRASYPPPGVSPARAVGPGPMAEDVTAFPTSLAGQLKGKTMKETRIEEDLLGSKEVPIGAYYGIHTVRALENFKISSAKISDVPEMVRGMAVSYT